MRSLVYVVVRSVVAWWFDIIFKRPYITYVCVCLSACVFIDDADDGHDDNGNDNFYIVKVLLNASIHL